MLPKRRNQGIGVQIKRCGLAGGQRRGGKQGANRIAIEIGKTQREFNWPARVMPKVGRILVSSSEARQTASHPQIGQMALPALQRSAEVETVQGLADLPRMSGLPLCLCSCHRNTHGALRS